MTDDYFADYDVYSEDSVVCILPDGIELSDGRKIIFKECVQNYHYHIGNTSDSNCIGENDRDDGSFMFYCSPHPVMIQVVDKFFSKSVQQRMNEWEKQIGEYGYSLTVCEMREDI